MTHCVLSTNVLAFPFILSIDSNIYFIHHLFQETLNQKMDNQKGTRVDEIQLQVDGVRNIMADNVTRVMVSSFYYTY
jgi:hypothetical protein